MPEELRRALGLGPSTGAGFDYGAAFGINNPQSLAGNQLSGALTAQPAIQGFGGVPAAANTGAAISEGLGGITGAVGEGFSNLGDYLGRQNLSDITGALGTGIQAYSSLFGPGREVADARLDLLRQQVGANREALDNRRRFTQNFARAANAVNARPSESANRLANRG